MAIVKSDRGAIKLRIKKAKEFMMPPLCQQILSDCNYYCREDQGELIASSLTASDLTNGDLVWDTSYALKVYYTGRPSHDVNAYASLMWCDKADKAHNEDWNTLANTLFERGMSQK